MGDFKSELIYCKGLTRVKYFKQYYRSIEGLIAQIYGHQRGNSKRRGHPMPDYSKVEFRSWIFSQPNFERLYQNWVGSGFEKTQRPSCDRLDDYRPYTLDNLQLVTWAENDAKGHANIKAGINNKKSKAVIQIDKGGDFVAVYHSSRHASRVTGVNQGNLSECCNGKRKSAGGYLWRFSSILRL